jgi:hypothetical protein
VPKVTLPLAALLFVACSSGSGPRPPVEPAPTPVVATPDAAPPELAEAELCPRLLERVRETSGSMPPEEMEKMSAVLTEHCNQWPEPVRRCLATSPENAQPACMDKLDAPARDAFLAAITAALQGAPECDELALEAAQWVKLPDTIAGDDRKLALASVRQVLDGSCRVTWSENARRCVGSATAAPRTCFDGPDDVAIGRALDAQLAPRTEVFTRAAAIAPTDKKIACAKVVAAHYGDAQWKGRLADLKSADRKKAIKASSKALAAACKNEGWSAFVRACVVTAKTADERGFCIDPTRWGYPAGAATATSSGSVPECDAYVAVMEKYITCDKIPQASRDAARQGLDAMKSAWVNPGAIPADARKAMADACKQGSDAMRQAGIALGCSL